MRASFVTGSLALRASRVTGENLVVHWSLGARWPEHISDSLSRIAGEGWGEGVPQYQLFRRYSGVHCGKLLTLFTVALRLSRPVGYIGWRVKTGDYESFQATEPLCAENLPHRPSTDPLRQNRNSLFHSGLPIFLAGYCPKRSKNSAQTGEFSVSSRCAGSQGFSSA